MSGDEPCVRHEVLHRGIEGGAGIAEWWRRLGDELEIERLEPRAQDAGLHLGEEQGHPAAIGRRVDIVADAVLLKPSVITRSKVTFFRSATASTGTEAAMTA